MTDAMKRFGEPPRPPRSFGKAITRTFIHPITDGVPRMDPAVLSAITNSLWTAWMGKVDVIAVGIEAMGLPLTARSSMAPALRRDRENAPMDFEGKWRLTNHGEFKRCMYLNDLKR